MPRSTRPRAARRPSSGSSASAARPSGCTTRTPRRRRTTPSSAWACASWSTARSGSPPPSTCGRRRRPASCAGPRRWRASRAARAVAASSWRPSPRTATSRGRAPSRSTRRPCRWPTRSHLLAEWSQRLARHDVVSHTSASLLAVSEQTYLADLNGTRATQHRVRLQAQLEALALSDSGFETMRTLAPPGRPRLGVPHRAGRRPATGTGTPSWPSCPSCWPRSCTPRRWRRGPTTSSSTRRTCG